MFEYNQLHLMTRDEVLNKSKEARAYWKFLYDLKLLWSGFGQHAESLFTLYMKDKKDQKAIRIFQEGLELGRVRLDTIIAELEKLDDYIRKINIELGDGSKWLTASEIEELVRE